MEEKIDTQYRILCAEILEPTLKKIALSFSVSTSEFYDTVHELSFTSDRLLSEDAPALGVEIGEDECLGYDRIQEVVKSKQRLYRIANRLLVAPKDKTAITGTVLIEPKIYDEHIYSSMAATYGTISKMIGDSLFTTLSTSTVCRALQLEERSGFTFSEFALYTCLYMAIKKSAVEVLNTPVETSNQKKRLRGRLRQIKQWLFSEEFRDSLTRTLINLLAKFNEVKYSLLMDKHCRDFWLPSEKRTLKYLDYALDKYALTIPNITKGKLLVAETAIDYNKEAETYSLVTQFRAKEKPGEDSRILSDEDVSQLVQSCIQENLQVQLYQNFFYTILPVIELIAEGTLPKGLLHSCNNPNTVSHIELKPYILTSRKKGRIAKEYVKRKDPAEYTITAATYKTAELVSNVFDAYIDSVINSVIVFLEHLPESRISGEKSLLEFLQSL